MIFGKIDIIEIMSNNKEWLFSGVGVAIVVFVYSIISKKRKNKSPLIKVTITGGAFLSYEDDTPVTINKNEISRLETPLNNELGTTKIIMNNGKEYYVSETKSKIYKLIRN